MSITRCFRVRDLVVMAVGFVVVAALWATGNDGWTGATSAALIPVLFAAHNYERRRK